MQQLINPNAVRATITVFTNPSDGQARSIEVQGQVRLDELAHLCLAGLMHTTLCPADTEPNAVPNPVEGDASITLLLTPPILVGQQPRFSVEWAGLSWETMRKELLITAYDLLTQHMQAMAQILQQARQAQAPGQVIDLSKIARN